MWPNWEKTDSFCVQIEEKTEVCGLWIEEKLSLSQSSEKTVAWQLLMIWYSRGNPIAMVSRWWWWWRRWSIRLQINKIKAKYLMRNRRKAAPKFIRQQKKMKAGPVLQICKGIHTYIHTFFFHFCLIVYIIIYYRG